MISRHVEFLKLVTSHQAALQGYIRSIAPGVGADDILQETNIVLWDQADRFELGTNFKAFAFRIAYLKTLEVLRRNKRKQWLVFDSDLMQSIAERQLQDGPVNESADDAQNALRECLAELNDGDRNLLYRRYSRGQSVREIARLDHCSEGSLQQLFFRLRNRLRDCIERKIACEGGKP